MRGGCVNSEGGCAMSGLTTEDTESTELVNLKVNALPNLQAATSPDQASTPHQSQECEPLPAPICQHCGQLRESYARPTIAFQNWLQESRLTILGSLGLLEGRLRRALRSDRGLQLLADPENTEWESLFPIPPASIYTNRDHVSLGHVSTGGASVGIKISEEADGQL